MMCADYYNLKNKVQNSGIKLLENFLFALGQDIRKMEFGRNGNRPCGKMAKWSFGEMGKLDEMVSGRNEKMGENEIGRNGKRAGQILGGMGKRRSWKGRKKNGRNGKNLGEINQLNMLGE